MPPDSKGVLRRSLKQKRLEMTDTERALKSREIVTWLKDVTDWSQIENLHYFEPIRQLLEVNTDDFITDLEDSYQDMKLFTPRLIGGSWQLVAVRGGSTQPRFDVIIVPMLGFDEYLNRIGYGGGYYDTFLASQPKAKKIGVCFEAGRVDKIPTEPHDVPLDIIVTDKAVYQLR